MYLSHFGDEFRVAQVRPLAVGVLERFSYPVVRNGIFTRRSVRLVKVLVERLHNVRREHSGSGRWHRVHRQVSLQLDADRLHPFDSAASIKIKLTRDNLMRRYKALLVLLQILFGEDPALVSHIFHQQVPYRAVVKHFGSFACYEPQRPRQCGIFHRVTKVQHFARLFVQ